MTRGIAILTALMALLPFLAACSGAGPLPAAASAGPGDSLPPFGRTSPRLREPSTERPPWLPVLPSDMERIRVPDDGHRDSLG
jgi:hypothetical protein